MRPATETALLRQFGERVRARREELAMSQTDLAAASGLHWSWISRVERGRANPGVVNIAYLATALQIDPGKLFEGLS